MSAEPGLLVCPYGTPLQRQGRGMVGQGVTDNHPYANQVIPNDGDPRTPTW